MSLLAVAFATLAPIEYRPVTEFPPQAERFGAFLIVTISLVVGYPSYRLLGICGLVVAAAALEDLQTVFPGRHGRFFDFEAKAAGVLAGALVGMMGEALIRPKPRDRDGGSKPR